MPESNTNVLTFPHGSIEQFFFSFTIATRMSLPWSWLIPDDAPIFMIDPLVFQFCLWFMYFSGKYPSLQSIRRHQILKAVQNEILRLCDRAQISRFRVCLQSNQLWWICRERK